MAALSLGSFSASPELRRAARTSSQSQRPAENQEADPFPQPRDDRLVQMTSIFSRRFQEFERFPATGERGALGVAGRSPRWPPCRKMANRRQTKTRGAAASLSATGAAYQGLLYGQSAGLGIRL